MGQEEYKAQQEAEEERRKEADEERVRRVYRERLDKEKAMLRKVLGGAQDA